ncbi:hypothetical protein CYMTET_30492 [Cymbomonas tetramitiformis]|uniref:Uncharacterized protein n=1 Tax=Cymbomonas tetramitiformis TaxID=36881 RepID=A0AAE0FBT0_9CHLO|nr:hypothetical protein CYMTET_34014 [Cymbomonas tetramitiformis]KAK3260553.1 hypothetical protein CYMTET_30492 [Cymbomonas tetramitiformis]
MRKRKCTTRTNEDPLSCAYDVAAAGKSPKIKRRSFGLARAALAAGLLAMLCNVNSVPGDFLIDDVMAVVTNDDVTGNAPLREIWRHDFWGKPISSPVSHKSYRPLTTLSFRANASWFGPEPFSFHAINVLLHGFVTGLFALMAGHICSLLPARHDGRQEAEVGGLVAGLIFAVHPIHTEAAAGLAQVANVTGRAELLSGLFYVLAFLAYASLTAETPDTRVAEARAPEAAVAPKLYTPGQVLRQVAAVGAAAVCGAAAMLCKEQGLTVLAVCALYDVCFHLRLHIGTALGDSRQVRPSLLAH